MNWRVKALIQFALAHLPFGERLNHMAQLANGSFRPDNQLRELLIQLRYIRGINGRWPVAGKTVAEIGPGWQGTGSTALCLFGVARTHAFDHQPHFRQTLIQRLAGVAAQNIDKLEEASGIAANVLQARLQPIIEAPSLESCIEAMRVTYCAPADAASTRLPDQSVDMVYSYGVLEHIPAEALEAITRESARILKPDGRACHNIGLHDHFHSAGLGNGVNFLRYPEWLWAMFCYNGILYHNRLRLPQYLQMFARHGLSANWMDRELLELNLKALRALKVDSKFRGMTEEDLAASHLYIELTR